MSSNRLSTTSIPQPNAQSQTGLQLLTEPQLAQRDRVAVAAGAGTKAGTQFQLLVVPNSTAVKAQKLNSRRIDAAHSYPKPHWQLDWVDQIGWHTAELATNRVPTAASSSVEPLPIQLPAPRFLRSAAASQETTVREISGFAKLVDDFEQQTRLQQLARQLARDINQPLIAAFQLINQVSAKARTQSFLTMADVHALGQACQRLSLVSQWTESVLLNSQIENDGLASIHKRFEVTQWKQHIETALQTLATARGVKLRWLGWDTGLPRLYLDVNHLNRLLMNLVANAVAASSAGATVVIRATWQCSVTQRLMISVEDTGIGMPSQMMRIINSSMAWPETGIGQAAGLTLARRLIGAIGGLIAAQKGPEGGTIIRLALPVDSYASVTRSWLLRCAGEEKGDSAYRICLFDITSVDGAANLFSQHLQRSAESKQLVYRVTDRRHLVVELKRQDEGDDSSVLAKAMLAVPDGLRQSQPWLVQSIYSSPTFALNGLLGRNRSSIRLPQLTDQLVNSFQSTIGQQPLFVDNLGEAAWLDQIGATASAEAALAVQPPATQTVQAIIGQWKQVQARLAQLT